MVRTIHSHVYNNDGFKHVTLIIDGKDVIVRLVKLINEKRKTKNGKSTLISKKLNWKNAGKQQIMVDSRGMTLSISDTKGANEIYDGHHMKEMFVEMSDDLKTFFNPNFDCLIMDNHFVSESIKFVKDNEDSGFTVNNLCLPISKERLKKFSSDEIHYKNKHGGYRSIIETETFANFVHKFKRFSNLSKVRTKDFFSFNTQFRVSMVIFNISNYARNYPHFFSDLDINFEDWMVKEFDFPTKPPIITSSPKLIELKNRTSLINQVQIKNLNSIIKGIPNPCDLYDSNINLNNTPNLILINNINNNNNIINNGFNYNNNNNNTINNINNNNNNYINNINNNIINNNNFEDENEDELEKLSIGCKVIFQNEMEGNYLVDCVGEIVFLLSDLVAVKLIGKQDHLVMVCVIIHFDLKLI